MDLTSFDKSSQFILPQPKRIFSLSQDQKIYLQYHLPKGFAFISQSSLKERKRKTASKESINIGLKDIKQPSALQVGCSKEERSQRPIRKVVSEQKKKKEKQLQRCMSQPQKNHIEKPSQKQEQSSSNRDLNLNLKKDAVQSGHTQNSIIQDREQEKYNREQKISKTSHPSDDNDNEFQEKKQIKTPTKLQAVKLVSVNNINPCFLEEFYILQDLREHDAIQPFLCPVDQIRDSAPDYYNIIKQPIDLQTIEQKLYSQEYTDPIEFHLDIEKMLANSRNYNQGNACMIKLTNQIQKFYQKLLKKNKPSKGETIKQNGQRSGVKKERGRTNKKETIAMKKQMKEK